MKKRILKRMGYSLLILSALMLKTACFNPSNAQDVLFYKSTDHIVVHAVSDNILSCKVSTQYKGGMSTI